MLYKVEDMATDQDMDYEQRAELRKRLAYPILHAFEKWMVQYYPKALQNGRMSNAVKYTYNIFHRLSRYHLDGRYQIDNNGIVLGISKKSWTKLEKVGVYGAELLHIIGVVPDDPFNEAAVKELYGIACKQGIQSGISLPE